MARTVDGIEQVIPHGFSRYLLVSILHGTNVVEDGATVEQWSLQGDLSRDPKVTGTLTIVHASTRGETWTPEDAQGVLSPFRATLLLTEVITAGALERRVQLGMFDVVGVPSSYDTVATVGARWVESNVTTGDTFDDEFPADDEFPGELIYGGGQLVGGYEVVVSSVVEVEVESLDGRVLGAGFVSPRTTMTTSAIEEWRTVGVLPVMVSADDVTLPAMTWPAENGSRLDAVQYAARALGGVPVVDSFGQWTLADDSTPTIELRIGESGTIVELSSGLSLDGFANVIVGDYEEDSGRPIRAIWVAEGNLSPSVMGREIVKYVTSDVVRTHAEADAHVAAEGAKVTSREIDVLITCVYDPRVELGDHVTVPGQVSGVVQRISVSDGETMQVTARTRRSL